jgi:hypothetical protein
MAEEDDLKSFQSGFKSQWRYVLNNAIVAQQVEHFVANEKAASSNLVNRSRRPLLYILGGKFVSAYKYYQSLCCSD